MNSALTSNSGLAEQGLTRSVLYVPGIRADLMAKVTRIPADVIQLDLEDSVPETQKDEARLIVRDFVRAWDNEVGQRLAVKINPISPKMDYSVPVGFEDVATIFAPSIEFIFVPKAESSDEIQSVDERLAQLESESGKRVGTTGLIPMIESARGLLNIHEIAQSCQRVFTLVYTGETDFQARLLASPEPTPPDVDLIELAYGRQQTVLACLAADLAPPIDTVTMDLENLDLLRSSSRIAQRLGYGGKFCVTPKQVTVVNEVFSPTEIEIDWARRVLEAVEGAAKEGRGAVKLDGRLVDVPMGLRAKEVLEHAEAVRRHSDMWAARA